MKDFDKFPKAFKQTVRYISQEASFEQLKGMEMLLSSSIYRRMEKLQQERTKLSRN